MLALPEGADRRRRVRRRGRRARGARGGRLEGGLVEKLGDVRYWYQRDGERVLKVVSFFLFSYRSGSVRDHDDEVDSAEWVPLEEAPRLLAYRGEREMAATALSRMAASK